MFFYTNKCKQTTTRKTGSIEFLRFSAKICVIIGVSQRSQQSPALQHCFIDIKTLFFYPYPI